MSNEVILHTNKKTLIAIYELLYHVRLGDRNKWESAISSLMIELEEEYDINSLIQEYLVKNNLVRPTITALCSDTDGLVIQLD